MPLLLVMLALGWTLAPAPGHAQVAVPATSSPSADSAPPPLPSRDLHPDAPPAAGQGLVPPSTSTYPKGISPAVLALEAQRQQKLRIIDAQLAPLLAERHRNSLALPITLMASSFGVGIVGFAAVFIATDGNDSDIETSLWYLVGGVAAAEFITGAVLMAVRIPRRRRDMPAIRELKRQRQALDYPFLLAPPPAGAVGLSLVGRF